MTCITNKINRNKQIKIRQSKQKILVFVRTCENSIIRHENNRQQRQFADNDQMEEISIDRRDCCRFTSRSDVPIHTSPYGGMNRHVSSYRVYRATYSHR